MRVLLSILLLGAATLVPAWADQASYHVVSFESLTARDLGKSVIVHTGMAAKEGGVLHGTLDSFTGDYIALWRTFPKPSQDIRRFVMIPRETVSKLEIAK